MKDGKRQPEKRKRRIQLGIAALELTTSSRSAEPLKWRFPRSSHGSNIDPMPERITPMIQKAT